RSPERRTGPDDLQRSPVRGRRGTVGERRIGPSRLRPSLRRRGPARPCVGGPRHGPLRPALPGRRRRDVLAGTVGSRGLRRGPGTLEAGRPPGVPGGLHPAERGGTRVVRGLLRVVVASRAYRGGILLL